MNISCRFRSFLLLLLLGAVISGCSETHGSLNPSDTRTPEGFPEMHEPSDNPTTSAKVELGRHLFYDKRLSRDFTTSCASCHPQGNGFSDPDRVSTGVEGRTGTRNAPSLTNVGYNTSLLWEGGVPSLEQQAITPIIHPDEMDMHTDTLVAHLNQVTVYKSLFDNAWGDNEITIERITKSLASFERMLVSANAPFDKWKRGDKTALSESAKRGRELFFNETGDCFHCHGGFNFTDNDFHNNGLSATEDEGRFRLTQRGIDRGKFKTPTLRNIEVTSPYMHDGRFTTLEEVLDHYNNGGEGHPNSGPLMRPLGLTETEKQEIIDFLKSLTDQDFLTDTSLSDPWK